MGASFGRTVLKNTDHVVYGVDRDEGVMLKAQLLNAITAPLDEKNASELDLLIVSVFPRSFKGVTQRFLPYMKHGSTVIDFCGVKRTVVKDMQDLAKSYPEINFIGGHPMAGREFSGIDHSITTLFNKASMILTPVSADIFVEDDLKKFFLSLGFERVVVTDAQTHDKTIAYTSQLCHIVSNAFIKSPTAEVHSGFSAGSYKDLTRVARMNPEMWTELVGDNRDNVIKELDVLISNLNEYKHAIENKDEVTLQELFDQGNKIKLNIDTGKSNAKTKG